MIQNQDTPTKIICCRVAMTEYIRFLTEASSSGLSISNWLLMKIYAKESEKVSQKASSAASKAADTKALNALRLENKNLKEANDYLRKKSTEMERLHQREVNESHSTFFGLLANLHRIVTATPPADAEHLLGELRYVLNDRFPEVAWEVGGNWNEEDELPYPEVGFKP